jgi:ABC-type Fe3+/spermidine/putrescine transport system ATPase subunit
MGLCGDSSVEADKNRRINQQMVQLKQTEAQVHKLLLLGAGGCGKSTVFKRK